MDNNIINKGFRQPIVLSTTYTSHPYCCLLSKRKKYSLCFHKTNPKTHFNYNESQTKAHKDQYQQYIYCIFGIVDRILHFHYKDCVSSSQISYLLQHSLNLFLPLRTNLHCNATPCQFFPSKKKVTHTLSSEQ